MKKHIIKLYTSVIAVIMLFSACTDFLDVTPYGQVKKDDILSTPQGIEDAMYGCYASMRNSSLYGRDLSFYTLEILSQYMECEGNESVEALLAYNYKDTRVKSIFEGIWTRMYSNISNVNAVLNCDLVKDAQEYPYTIYKGEALGLRAFMHFDLLRIFTEQITQNPKAEGIPYATEFSLKTPEFVTAAKAYELILNDLLEAERLLADEEHYMDKTPFMTDRNIHFNLWAVKATLARVYLTMDEKEKAAQYALDVIEHVKLHTPIVDEDGIIINSGEVKLLEPEQIDGAFAGVLSRDETIFGIYYADFYSEVDPILQKQTSYKSLDPRADITTYYVDNVTGLDKREAAYIQHMPADGTGWPYRLKKLTDVYELDNREEDRPKGLILGINMIRLPEMYYIAAECLLDTDYDKAESLIDAVYASRGLDPVKSWPAPNNKLTVSVITAERNREFIGEGQIFFNMKRLNLQILSVDSKQTFQPSKDIYVVPVPDIEFDYRK